jgi:hypothetical protein
MGTCKHGRMHGPPKAVAHPEFRLCTPCDPQVRTQTLVKNAIVQIDATPFKQWYQTHYGVELGNKGKVAEEAKPVAGVGVEAPLAGRN